MGQAFEISVLSYGDRVLWVYRRRREDTDGFEQGQAIDEWPRPNTVHRVRAFCGLCSYYRKFIKDFAWIAHPLVRTHQEEQETRRDRMDRGDGNGFCTAERGLESWPGSDATQLAYGLYHRDRHLGLHVRCRSSPARRGREGASGCIHQSCIQRGRAPIPDARA